MTPREALLHRIPSSVARWERSCAPARAWSRLRAPRALLRERLLTVWLPRARGAACGSATMLAFASAQAGFAGLGLRPLPRRGSSSRNQVAEPTRLDVSRSSNLVAGFDVQDAMPAASNPAACHKRRKFAALRVRFSSAAGLRSGRCCSSRFSITVRSRRTSMRAASSAGTPPSCRSSRPTRHGSSTGFTGRPRSPSSRGRRVRSATCVPASASTSSRAFRSGGISSVEPNNTADVRV
jgi:hypothetical protein